MNEWLPAVLGCIWGVLAGSRAWHARPGHRGASTAALSLGACGAGLLAAVVTGELAASGWFAVVDAAIAGGATVAGAAAVRLAQPIRAPHRGAHRRARRTH